jgi:transposase
MATTFKATLDEVERFREAQQVVANLGLVPREREGTVNSRGEVGKTDGSPTSLPPPSKLYGR